MANVMAAIDHRSDTFWLIALSSTLVLAAQPFSSYAISLPFIRAEWEMSNAQAGLVFSFYLIGWAFISLIVIPLTDSLSARRVMVFGLVAMVVSHLLFPLLARSIWSGCLLRFIAGAGHVALYVPGIRLVSQRFASRKRGTAVAVFVGAGYAGTTLSYTFMGELLSYTQSWRTAYFVTALTALIGLVLAIYVLESKTTERIAQPSSDSRRPKSLLDLSVLHDRSVQLVILAYALHTAELYLARLWLPLLLGATFMRAGKGELEATALAGRVSGFIFVTGIAGVFLGGVLSDRFGRSASAASFFALSGSCSFILGWLAGAPPFFLIGIGFVYGFVTAADSAVYSTAITELSPSGKVGSTQAVQSFFGSAAGAAAPIIAGSILDLGRTRGGWELAFSFNGVLAVVGVIALLWLGRMPQTNKLSAEDRESTNDLKRTGG